MKNILVVEDSRSTGSLVCQKFTEADFKVAWVKSMAEAATLLDAADTEFFCSILDLTLPDAPNGEIMDLVMARNIPVIVFTGNLDKGVREMVWSKSVVDYVLKDNPDAADYLVTMVQRLERNSQTKVLVADDSGFFRTVVVNLLKMHRFQVLTAASGQEAQIVSTLHPDLKLLVTDFNMPNMNGLQLTQAIRRTHKRDELAIIGISSQGDQIMAANFIKYGANDFLIKQTFLTEEFYCRVNQCLDLLYSIQTIKDAATKDYLTGLYNRRYFFEFGSKLFAGAVRSKFTLACGMLDIDFFKKVNDTYGHDAGDRALKHLGKLLSRRMRETDLLARMGGEEFCILAVAVSPDKVETLFEEIRRLIEDTPVDIGGGTQIRITASIGVATGGGAYSLDEMLKFADEQLYAAKSNGRNRVMAHCCDL